MAGRPVHTVIFLGAQRTDRVDLGRAPTYSVIAEHHQVSHGSDDPVSRIEASLASSKVGKLVWVLWEGASAQMLDMPTGVVDGLERDQLGDSLSYEAEPLSGISAGDSAIDGIPQRNPAGALPDYRRYWVTQLPRSVNDQLEKAVTACGAKLAGIAHPGGLPRERWDAPISSDAGREWRRIEIWDQLTFALQGRPDGSVDTRIIRAAPGSEGWLNELPTNGSLSWMGQEPAARGGQDGRRISDSLIPLEEVDEIPVQPVKVDFPPNGAPVEWMRAWAAELTAQPRRVPSVRQHSHVSPDRKFYVTGGLAAALVLAVCAAHATWIKGRTADAKADADHLNAIAAQFAPKDNSAKDLQIITPQIEAMKSQLKDLDAHHATLVAEYDRRQKLMAAIAAHKEAIAGAQVVHRPAVAELLAAMADAEASDNAGDIVIKEVRKQDTGELQLTGLCKQSVFADALATRLETRLKKVGWKVGAAQKRLRDDGLAFDYSITLTPRVLSDLPLKSGPDTTTRPTARPATPPMNGSHSDGAQTATARFGGQRQ